MNNSTDYSKLSNDDKTELIQKYYIDEKMSFEEIATKLDTYGNKIRRDAIKLGFAIRSRSESQTIALEKGTAKHPTKGKKHSDDTKLKISGSNINNWANLSDKEREARAQISKNRWDSMTDEDKEAFNNAKFEAIRTAAKEGSKLEKFIHGELIGAGYVVLYHQKHLLNNEKLELDILLPEYKIAIEIDGISHVEAVWGEDTFQRNQQADLVKNALLTKGGYYIIRVISTSNVTLKHKNVLWTKLQNTIKDIVAGSIVEKKLIQIIDE